MERNVSINTRGRCWLCVLAGSVSLAAPKSVPEGCRPAGPPPHTVLPSLSDLPPRFLRSPRLCSQCMLHHLVPLSRVLRSQPGRPEKCAGGWSPDWSAPTHHPALLVRLAASAPALAPTALPMHASPSCPPSRVLRSQPGRPEKCAGWWLFDSTAPTHRPALLVCYAFALKRR